MTTYAIQDIFTESDANAYMLSALEDVNYDGHENFSYIFKGVMRGLGITPDTVLYYKINKYGVSNVTLELFTDKACTKYIGLDILIEEPASPAFNSLTVTLGVADTPYVTFK